MKNIILSKRSRVESIMENVVDTVMTVSGIAIGLSPLLAFIK